MQLVCLCVCGMYTNSFLEGAIHVAMSFLKLCVCVCLHVCACLRVCVWCGWRGGSFVTDTKSLLEVLNLFHSPMW